MNAYPPTLGPNQRLFVVLQHTGVNEPHYDLLLETIVGGPLLTWRCPIWPILAKTAVARQPDHRHAYIDYEGPISGGRGTVRRVDYGSAITSGGIGDAPMAALISLQSGQRLALRQDDGGHVIVPAGRVITAP